MKSIDFVKAITEDSQLEKDFQKHLGGNSARFNDELSGMIKVYNDQVIEVAAYRFDAEIYVECVKLEPNNADMKQLLTDKTRGYILKKAALAVMRKQILQKLSEEKGGGK